MPDLTGVSKRDNSYEYGRDATASGPEPPAGKRTEGARSPGASPTNAPEELGAGVRQLLERYGNSPTANNAQRTSARDAAAYADAGVTSTGDTVYAGVAALKGRDAKTGIEVEVFSASGQVGGENEVQAGLARVGASGKSGSIGAEVFTVRAAGGAHNEDGSVGFNSSAMATALGAEGTVLIGEESVTLGASLSVGAAVSAGVKDADADGNPEYCAKVSLGPVTVGACVED